MSHPFTETYIKMAKAAEEIQAMQPPFQEGDAVFVIAWGRPAFVGALRNSTFQGLWLAHADAAESDLDAFWLPRMDQLLKLISENGGFEMYFTTNQDFHEAAMLYLMRDRFEKEWDFKEGIWY